MVPGAGATDLRLRQAAHLSQSKVMGGSQEILFAFHAACVEDLLGALDDSSNFPGDYLAAACLLQLYEILNGNDLSLHHLAPPWAAWTCCGLDGLEGRC